jgi:hypothetical protein
MVGGAGGWRRRQKLKTKKKPVKKKDRFFLVQKRCPNRVTGAAQVLDN